MLRTRERTREIDAAVADIRAIEQHDGATRESLDRIKQRLIALADRHTIIERGRAAWQGSSAQLAADHGLWRRYLGV